MNKELQSLWESSGFVGGRKLYQIAKSKNLKVTFKEVDEFVKSQDTAQVHKPVKVEKKKFQPITTPFPKFEMQMDLADMSNYSRQNKGNKWILMVIDIFSRRAFAVPIKSKRPVDVLEGMKDVFEKFGYVPAVIRTDDGNEYKHVVNSYLKEKKIQRVVSKSEDHRVFGVIDSFTKNLKTALQKYMTEHNTAKWLDYLKIYITGYNDRPHDSLKGDTPNGAEKHTETTLQTQIEKINVVESGLKVGDDVRTKLKKNIHSKGYERNWSIRTYKIKEIEGNRYTLSNDQVYKSDDLQKVNLTVDDEPVVRPLVPIAETINKQAKESKRLAKL